jgi:hypothetical protein
MNEATVKALLAMQDSGWGVGGSIVEDDVRIEANYKIGQDEEQDNA